MAGLWVLVGFGFGNLAMLGWLAAAAAPLLIHLWSQRRYRETPWAAMTFLMAAVRKHSRRIQLEQWLLLALRTLLIMLVVMAVAEPYAEQWGAGLGGAPTHRVLVVDTSFSMGYRESDKTRLAQVQQLAAELVEGSGPSDACTIITLSDPPRRVVDRDIADRRMVAERIDALTATQTPANLSATLDLVSAAIALPPQDAQRFERQEVHIFTDLQRSTWEAADSSELRAKLATIAKQAAIHLIDVGTPHAANLAVTNLKANDPFVTVGRPATFDATLHEYGDQPRTGCRIEFLADGTPVGEQTIDIPAGGETTVRFAQDFRTAGSHVLEVRAAGDWLEVDNTRWLALPVKERVRVLCVGGAPADTRYIADALNPGRSDEASISVSTITEGELAETDFSEFDSVFLSNVAQLTADEANRLAEYVRQGGGLAVFLGDRIIAESYNRATNADEPLLPARLGDAVEETRFGLDPRDYQHPIVAPFRGRERAGLLSTPIDRYIHLEVPDAVAGRPAEVAIAMPAGDPLVVTTPLGRGRVVLVATAGSMSSVDAASGQPWTTWPAWPSFLPVVREILAYTMGGQQRAWQTTVGEPIVIANDLRSDVGTQSLERPDGQQGPLRTSDSAGERETVYADTNVSGIYTLQNAAEEVTHFAVNVDTRESDLAQVDTQSLPDALDFGDQGRGENASSNSWQHAAWQRALLWSAFAIALVELLLAWRFGRGK